MTGRRTRRSGRDEAAGRIAGLHEDGKRMALTLRPLGDVMGLEVVGLDLTRPPENGVVAELNEAFHDGLVLCTRDQSFTPPHYLAASRCFGDPHMQPPRPWWQQEQTGHT